MSLRSSDERRLSEELLTAEEGTDSTTQEKVFVARLGSRWESQELASRLERLREAVERGVHDEIVALLREMVPSYRPANSHQRSAISGQ